MDQIDNRERSGARLVTTSEQYCSPRNLEVANAHSDKSKRRLVSLTTKPEGPTLAGSGKSPHRLKTLLHRTLTHTKSLRPEHLHQIIMKGRMEFPAKEKKRGLRQLVQID